MSARFARRGRHHAVLTHHHFDHILGSAGFTDAELYAAPSVAAALTTDIADVRAHAISYGADPAELDRTIARCAPRITGC